MTQTELSIPHSHTIIPLTQNVHIHQPRIHLHVSLTLNSLLGLPFEEESPVGRTLKAQTVTLQRITPVWVPPWSSGSTAPSYRSRVTNIIRICYRHFYPVRHRTQLTSHYLIYSDSTHFALSEIKSKPETIGHFISKIKHIESNHNLGTRTAQPEL